ncbi:hypothetical protein ABZ173_02765 [Streptomyces rochei]|uniref:hypothetical protein n=1 Tax=Streptomyces rochei TaxID=1928 RepID=UPI0033A804E2
MGFKKILTVKLEIEVNNKVTREGRLRDTYEDVVTAAMEAARTNMPQDSIKQITTHARWEYRQWDPTPTIYPEGKREEIEFLDEDEIEDIIDADSVFEKD